MPRLTNSEIGCHGFTGYHAIGDGVVNPSRDPSSHRRPFDRDAARFEGCGLLVIQDIGEPGFQALPPDIEQIRLRLQRGLLLAQGGVFRHISG